MNNVQSNNGRGLVGAGVTAWLEEKVEESPGCVERFVCETHRTGQSLAGPAYYLMALSKYDSQPVMSDIDKLVKDPAPAPAPAILLNLRNFTQQCGLRPIEITVFSLP